MTALPVILVIGVLFTINTTFANNYSLCKDPGLPLNGLRYPAKSLYQHNETVTFGCKAKYTIKGKSVLLCQSNGTWNGNRPLCLGGNKRCPNPGFPKDWPVARLDYYPHGQIVQSWYCRSSIYKLNSPPYTRCQDGKWTPSFGANCHKIELSVNGSDESCGNNYVSSSPPIGHIMSPGYPQKYSDSKSCSWTINSNTQIGIYFKTFQTEAYYDFVRVYDGASASAPLIGSYNGSTLPPYITSTHYRLYITFTSDGSVRKKGFAAYFEALKWQSLRLVGGTGSRSGRLEMFYRNEWGTVCDDYWDIRDANVTCKQLGFPEAIAAHRSAKYGQGTGNIWLDNVACKGSESDLRSCSAIRVNPWTKHDCDHSEDAGVECKKRVRLANGGASYGRVEVYHEGQWGTVFDDLWDINDANVVCRELGFSRASNAYGSAHYGQGSGPVWIDEVACQGSEDSLLSCGFLGWIKPNCPYYSHSEDAGVKCV